ncbi:Uncharacterised protein [Mycobacteroides abscessus subsp. abscessus]|nr:Uncharacterised protein [Mycobacteroides abscessus subsp. abscessus]
MTIWRYFHTPNTSESRKMSPAASSVTAVSVLKTYPDAIIMVILPWGLGRHGFGPHGVATRRAEDPRARPQ